MARTKATPRRRVVQKWHKNICDKKKTTKSKISQIQKYTIEYERYERIDKKHVRIRNPEDKKRIFEFWRKL